MDVDYKRKAKTNPMRFPCSCFGQDCVRCDAHFLQYQYLIFMFQNVGIAILGVMLHILQELLFKITS